MITLDKVMEKMPNVHFYWAGDGQYKSEILPLYQKHKNFHYLGTLDYPDKVREFLTEIDLYALPTGMDTTPLSCREAMSMEKPIIASKVGGIPEMIYDNKTGLLVNEGDYEKWIQCINKIIEDNDFAEKLGKEARKLVLEKFNWKIVAKKFLDVAESHLSKN